MKVFLLALFVAAAVAAPAPLEEEIGEPVELIVNGDVEGEPLELGDVLDIKVKEHIDGEIASSTNLLHPLTAAGLAEAAAALDPTPDAPLEDIEIVEINPVPVELPSPVLPELVPEPVLLPEPVLPEVVPEVVAPLPEPVSPEITPEVIQDPHPLPQLIPSPPVAPLPEPISPELIPEPIEFLPLPAPQLPSGEVYNDGIVQVTLNTAEPGVLSTIQSWFNMVLNYFNDGVQTTQQIV